MAKSARSMFLVGNGIMGIGLLWLIVIWKGGIDFFPAALDQPLTALFFAVAGYCLASVSKKMGDGDPARDGFDLTDIVPERFRGGGKAKARQAPVDTSRRMDAYHDMLEDAPAEFHQPGQPVTRQPKEIQVPASGPERAELISTLLSGGVKAAQGFTPGAAPVTPATGAPAATDGPPPASAAPAEAASPEAGLANGALPEIAPDLNQGRLRLKPAVPQRVTDSWIGGCPEMPEEMEWPMLSGKPASFYAQICLKDLPRETWAGLGPREGWLIFFAADDPGKEVVVRHTVERGVPRPLPEGADYYFQYQSGEEHLAELIGPEALQPPRWYLEVQRDDDPTRADLTADLRNADILGKPTMTDPGFLPFDWPTGFALLDCVDQALVQRITRAQKTAPEGDSAAQAKCKAMAVMLLRLRKLTEKFEARAEALPFDDAECARLVGTLAKMTNASWMGAEAEAQGRKPISLLQLRAYGPYRKIFEAQARRVYTSDPSALPEAATKRLLPLWQAMAAKEALTMGNAAGEGLPKQDPCLLVLPSSELAGWQIGDLSRWAVQISPEALVDGRFDLAVAQNSEGKRWGT